MLGLARGVAFFILLFLGGATVVIMLIPTVFVMFVHSVSVIKWKRAYINALSRLFFDYAAFLLTHLCGTKVTIYSDDPNVFISLQNDALFMNNYFKRIETKTNNS